MGSLDRERIRVLITVKAYPQLSEKYKETVCVAGIRLDGMWPEHVRLFPIPFRDLDPDKQFKKYEIVELEVSRHQSDDRPESRRPHLDTLTRHRVIGTADGWRERAKIVAPLVAPSLCEIKRRQQRDGTSLGVFQPASIERFRIAPAETRSASLEAMASQLNLFDPERRRLEALPYRFTYRFRCDDAACSGHEMGLIDWEISAAYLRWRTLYDGDTLLAKLRERWYDDICAATKATHFFVGNVHKRPHQFMLLGAFYPDRDVMRAVTSAPTLF